MGCFSRVRCISGAEGNCQEFVISHALLIVEVMKLKAPTKVKIFGWRTLKGKTTHPTFILYIEINVNSACILVPPVRKLMSTFLHVPLQLWHE